MNGPDQPQLVHSRRTNGRRLLLVGEFGAAYPCHYFARTLREAGWQVIELDFTKFFPRTENSFISRLASRLLSRESSRILTNAIQATAFLNDVDYVLFTKAIGATGYLIKNLHDRKVTTCCWYPDVHFDHSLIDGRVLNDFDIFITTKDFHLPYLIKHRPDKINKLVEHGYCDDVHWRSNPITTWQDRRYDIVFVGNHSTYKEQWLTGLAMRRPTLNYLIIGTRWQHTRWPAAAKTVTVCDAMAGDAMSRAINNSRIAVSVHHGPVDVVEGWQDSISARTFEIPACGTPMVHIAEDYLSHFFNAGTEVACFSDMSGLVCAVDELLDDPQRAMAMAQRAYNRAVPAYGYLARGREIAEIIGQFDTQFRENYR